MTPQTAELWTAWTTRRDERAFEALVRPELPHALGFARRLGCNAADADDALQDALTRLASLREDAPAAIGVRAWLCREVHVRARSRLRSERRRRTRESAVAVPDARESGAAPIEIRDEVERALAGLDADERIAVELRHLHDLDYREMARVLGASEGACRQRVHKALANLRARLGRDAAALVAALPLPAVRDASAFVKGAVAKSMVHGAAAQGATIMATTTQKIAIAAAFALAIGVTGTLALQRSAAPAVPADAASVPDARDAEIARLRTQLADTQRRSASSRSAGDARADRRAPAPAPAPSADVSTTVQPAREVTVGVVGPGAPAGGVATSRSGELTDKIDLLKVMERGAPWEAALRQAADPARRDAAWAQVRQALTGTDAVATMAAMQVIWSTQAVQVDRTGVRELLLPFADASDPEVKLAAWAALIGNGVAPGDVDRLRGQILDVPAAQRPEMIHRLNWATKGVLDGANADVVLDTLADPTTRWEVIMAIQNARLNDAVVAKLLEYARSGPDAAQHAQQFVFRALPDKNRDVVAFLLDRAEGGDLTAIEKFEGTIRREDVVYAGERLRRLYDSRTQASVRAPIVATIGRIGDAASRDWLTAVRDDAAADGAVQRAAREAVQALDRAPR